MWYTHMILGLDTIIYSSDEKSFAETTCMFFKGHRPKPPGGLMVHGLGQCPIYKGQVNKPTKKHINHHQTEPYLILPGDRKCRQLRSQGL